MDIKSNFSIRVERICKEVERLLLEEGQFSHGITITINMNLDEVDHISFEVREKVKFNGNNLD